MSGEQFSGLSIRYPSLRRRNKSSFGIPGYGLPPNVTISHNTIPKDQLLAKRKKENNCEKTRYLKKHHLLLLKSTNSFIIFASASINVH